MPNHKIAVIKGDGIGVDVVNEGIKVLDALAPRYGINWEYTEFNWSSDYYFEHGKMMPDDALESLEPFNAVFLGAVGHPDIQDNITLDGLLLPIRRRFDQYICLRPSVLYPGVKSPLAGKKPYDIDLVVIRENTEGEYLNIGGFAYHQSPDEVAVQTAVYTRKGCERAIRYAFDLARKRGKKHRVTSITKSNALGYMTLWDRTFSEVAEEYTDIESTSLLIDAACMDLVRKPEMFDVIVAPNLFGDIITDIGAIISGSMGLASSANINPDTSVPSMFEPTHGSAPDIAGQGIANPMAQILTGAMMLRHLGEEAAASDVDQAVLRLLERGEILTPDLGGSSTTESVGDAIAELVSK
ncbi:MAG: 3-isopropylmalate dehydrogenase [SAR202 cluster bacterium]|nr:3-isopropylmalate dehydrogenase [SAR202 cluster bacterium]|tara:strand:+ start:2384 stop:3448 length:1065 start_codon:yes stop_codon:yes gene_type:complete